MKAIILAAGRGSRMKEKTEALPKCLVELWGKTLLDWQIKALREAGIEDIAIITGYRAEEIERRQPKVTYFHNADWEQTNMVSTLLKADAWLKEDDCIISYADIVYTSKAVKLLKDSHADLALTYYTEFLQLWKQRFANPLEDIETFRLNGTKLKEIGQKAQSLDEIEGQYMGLLKFTPQGYAKILKQMDAGLPKPLAKMDMTGLLSHLLANGMEIEALPYDELWLEVDNQHDLELYETWENRLVL